MNSERERVPARAALRLELLVRHQAGALAVTLLDFSVMTALVWGFGVGAAVPATAAGAAVGGVTNFILGRKWIFKSAGPNAGHQALRYTLVSGASLLLNAGGEHLLVDRLGLQFQVARVLVAAIVSVAWNFPMHRFFVFQDRPGPAAAARTFSSSTRRAAVAKEL